MLGWFSVFDADIERLFVLNYDKIVAFLLRQGDAEPSITSTRVYGLMEVINYRKLHTRMINNKLN